jgi:hypothetical protein
MSTTDHIGMILSSIAFATKQLISVLPVALVFMSQIGFADVQNFLGATGVAAVASVLGVLARWFWFKLRFQNVWREFIAAPITSIVFASTWPPVLETWIGASANNGPSIVGFVIGLFGFVAVTWVNDFFTSMKQREGEV